MKNIYLKLENSIEKNFYYEALFLLSSIIENETKKVYKKENNNARVTFEESINYLYQNNLINQDLHNNLHKWREKRNILVHSLISSKIDEKKLISIVKNGKEFMGELFTCLEKH